MTYNPQDLEAALAHPAGPQRKFALLRLARIVGITERRRLREMSCAEIEAEVRGWLEAQR